MVDLEIDIGAIVGELRELRESAMAVRRREDQPVKLPSRKVLASVVDGLSAALFPQRLGPRELNRASVDFFVGQALDRALHDLQNQVQRETAAQDDTFRESVNAETVAAGAASLAAEIVANFSRLLPGIRRALEADVQAIFDGENAARSVDEVLGCYPTVRAIVHYRFAHVLDRLGAPLVARMIADIAHSTTGIEIHPQAIIGRSFAIHHGTGVVIGRTAVIGDRVRLFHGVTLGAAPSTGKLSTNGFEPSSCPKLEDDVTIYSGATILGSIVIGRGSVIGGNVWLTESVAPGSFVTQAHVLGIEYRDGSGI